MITKMYMFINLDIKRFVKSHFFMGKKNRRADVVQHLANQHRLATAVQHRALCSIYL